MFEKKDIIAEYEFAITSESNCMERIEGEIDFESETAMTAFLFGPRSYFVYIDKPENAKTPMLRVLFSSLGEVPFLVVKIVTPNNNNHVAVAINSSHRELFSVSSGTHEIHINGTHYKTFTLKPGSIITMIAFETSNKRDNFQIHLVEITAPNSMSMLWQLPQYIVLMFSVTGLELSYAQAPSSMKSVLQACWLLTIAIGNVIVSIITGARIS